MELGESIGSSSAPAAQAGAELMAADGDIMLTADAPVDPTGAAGGAGAGVPAPRRVRFSGSDDLRLVQCVRTYQPYAAEHGRKIRMWESIAQELRLSAEKMSLVQLTGRAVSDRFQLLLKLHRNGTLRVKSPPATAVELHQVINGMLRDISSHIDEIRASRGKLAKGSGDPLRLHATVPAVMPAMAILAGTAAAGGANEDEDEDEHVALAEEAEDDEDGAVEGMTLLNQLSGRAATAQPQPAASVASPVFTAPSATSTPAAAAAVVREDNDATVSADDAVAAADDPEGRQSQLSQQPRGRPPTHSQSLSAQLVALEAEKVRLKKRKLALLVQQHEERMALERQRLELEARRARDESAARRREWQELLARLGGGGGGGNGGEASVPLPHP